MRESPGLPGLGQARKNRYNVTPVPDEPFGVSALILPDERDLAPPFQPEPADGPVSYHWGRSSK